VENPEVSNLAVGELRLAAKLVVAACLRFFRPPVISGEARKSNQSRTSLQLTRTKLHKQSVHSTNESFTTHSSNTKQATNNPNKDD
jgi:hypothetical protein